MSHHNDFAGKLLAASLLLFFGAATTAARVLRVPEEYPAIYIAIAASAAEDTILVNRGVYPEQLRFPAHRISVMSHYELTGDTLDVTQTVIDGSAYADQDTATIALFLRGTALGCKLCGFTLTGGRGIGPGGWSGVFYADSSSPVICHNVITGNSTVNSPVGNFFNCSGVFRGNHIFDNTFTQSALRINYNLGWDPVLIEGNLFGPNPNSPNASYAGVLVNSGASAIIHGNVFRGLTGRVDLAILHFGRRPVVTNNVFDSLSVYGWGCSIVWLEASLDVTLTDNVFTNIHSEDGVVMVICNRNQFSVTVEGNLFENIRTPGYAGDPSVAGILLQGYRGVIRNNIFRSNRGSVSGAIYMTSTAGENHGEMVIENNLFDACSTYSTLPVVASCLMRGGYTASITARHNIFQSNAPRVVTIDNILPDRIADFRENYWGHPSGPYHPFLNPAGLGDVVGDSVLFEPWLTDSTIDAAQTPPAWIPAQTELSSRPNPFNATTRLTLTVSKPDVYSVNLYAITGQWVRELWNGAVVVSREIMVSAGDLPSGVYFAAARGQSSPDAAATVKLVLIR